MQLDITYLFSQELPQPDSGPVKGAGLADKATAAWRRFPVPSRRAAPVRNQRDPMSDLPDRATRSHVCGLPGPQEEMLAAAGLDRFELQSLDLLRLLFAAESGNRPRHGATADGVAVALFGATEGPVLLLALSTFIHTMARGRTERFRYSNPYCAGCARVLTRHEAGLMRILHHLRRARPGAAMIEALLLCEAQPVAPLLEVAADLAALAPPVSA